MSAGPTEIVKTDGKAVTKPQTPSDTFRDLLEKLRPQIQMALPKHLDIDRVIRICMTTVQRTPDLLLCTQESLLGCIFQSLQLGLEPDGLLGHAYLIPFNNRKTGKKICTLIVGYKGLLKLARQSGEVSSVSARVVYSEDIFEYEFGLNEKLVHKPVHGVDGEKIAFAYAVFRYKDGGHHFDVMSVAEIEAIRKRSMASEDGPWQTDYDEMAKKTVLRRASKMAPASIEDLQRAIAIDGRSEAGYAPPLPIEFQLPASPLPGSAPEDHGRRLSLARKPDNLAAAAAAAEKPLAAGGKEDFVISTSKQRREITIAANQAHVQLADVAKWFMKTTIDELSHGEADQALAQLRKVTGEGAEPPEPGSSG